jgi:hypothetical protein
MMKSSQPLVYLYTKGRRVHSFMSQIILTERLNVGANKHQVVFALKAVIN